VKGRDNDLSGEIEVGIFGGNSKAWKSKQRLKNQKKIKKPNLIYLN
jgi:hypothetical protein